MHIFPRLFFKTARPSFRSFWKKKNLSFPSHTHKHIPRKQSALKIESWAPFSLWPESDFAEKKKIFRKCTRWQFVRSPLSSHLFSCRKKIVCADGRGRQTIRAIYISLDIFFPFCGNSGVAKMSLFLFFVRSRETTGFDFVCMLIGKLRF